VIEDFTMNPSIVVAAICCIWGVAFVARGLFSKNVHVAKKSNILLGAILLIIATVQLVNVFAIKESVIFPIVAIILTGALVLGVLAVGGKKWDQGDNRKAGYKSYHDRKKEKDRN
jgi:hypothetical protein